MTLASFDGLPLSTFFQCSSIQTFPTVLYSSKLPRMILVSKGDNPPPSHISDRVGYNTSLEEAFIIISDTIFPSLLLTEEYSCDLSGTTLSVTFCAFGVLALCVVFFSCHFLFPAKQRFELQIYLNPKMIVHVRPDIPMLPKGLDSWRQRE
ncbi:hypothetical protein ABW19_dt0209908 [Dactylella cylindrospora]|nr:hypothetical protein ABW19_dt0209908 [Dactylella cylindrospora]